MYCIIQSIVWKLLEFPVMVDDLCRYSLQLPTKGFQLVFSISAQKYSDCSKFQKFPVLVWQFLPFHCSF